MVTLILILSCSVLFTRAKYTTIFELKLTDYRNPEDTLLNGRKCDSNFLSMRDKCDPKFILDVYFGDSRYSNIHYTSSAYKDTTVVHHVFASKDVLENFPINIGIIVNVYDEDSRISNEKIAEFTFKSTNISRQKLKRRIGTTKSILLEFELKCKPKYYGKKCTQYCHPVSNFWFCDIETGEHVCFYNCGHGRCTLESVSYTDFKCICETGWKGNFCNETFDAPSILETFVNQTNMKTSSTTSQTMLTIIVGHVSTAILVMLIIILATFCGIKAFKNRKLTRSSSIAYRKDTVVNGAYAENGFNFDKNLEFDSERYSNPPGAVLCQLRRSGENQDTRYCEIYPNRGSMLIPTLPSIQATEKGDIYEEISEESFNFDQEYEVPD